MPADAGAAASGLAVVEQDGRTGARGVGEADPRALAICHISPQPSRRVRSLNDFGTEITDADLRPTAVEQTIDSGGLAVRSITLCPTDLQPLAAQPSAGKSGTRSRAAAPPSRVPRDHETVLRGRPIPYLRDLRANGARSGWDGPCRTRARCARNRPRRRRGSVSRHQPRPRHQPQRPPRQYPLPAQRDARFHSERLQHYALRGPGCEAPPVRHVVDALAFLPPPPKR